jgi:uncharacterized protein (TIGR00369 family)
MNEATASKIRDSFAAQSLMATFGAELERVAPGAVEICAPILPGSRQQHGFAHAGLTFALGDSAAGYAALTLMPEEAEVMTAEMKINLLAPARGERLVATGRVVKAGRRLTVVTAEVAVEAAGEVSGHYHPKARLAGQARPCFLVDDARVILPAYGTYTGGLNCSDPTLAGLMAPGARAVLTGRVARAVPMPQRKGDG